MGTALPALPGVLILAYLFIVASVHINKYQNDPQRCMSSATRDTGSQIKRISVKEPTWRDLHTTSKKPERATMACLAG